MNCALQREENDVLKDCISQYGSSVKCKCNIGNTAEEETVSYSYTPVQFEAPHSNFNSTASKN